MTNEGLRNMLMRRIDSLLARTFLVWGDDRALLSALRGYATAMSEADLDRLKSFFPKEFDMAKKKVGDHHDKLAPYADMSQALYGTKLVLAHVRNGLVDGLPVDLACAVQGGHNALGFALSYLPHNSHAKPAAKDLSAASDSELADNLEAALPADDKFGEDPGSWVLIVLPILWELLKRWLDR